MTDDWKQEDESWRQMVERIGAEQGLETECLAYFDCEVAASVPEARAAWNALYEWDCLSPGVLLDGPPP